jgi:acyl carrier protein
MDLDATRIRAAIRDKLVEIAEGLGADAASIGDDDIIPATGVLDSAAIFELVAWYELHFQLALKQEEINIDNLGSIHRMADYVLKRKAGKS